MKVMTKTRLDKIDRYLAEAALLLRKADAVCRNAHRSWWIHRRVACALDDVKSTRFDIDKGWQNGYLVPPRTRKVLRMERMEQEWKEKHMKRVTMGGSSTAQGAAGRLPPGGCPGGERT